MTMREDLDLIRHLGLLVRRRELLAQMIRREISSRYRQTLLGMAWSLLKPLATVAVFTLIFSGIAKLPSERIPYPLFFMAGLMPWTMLSSAVTSGISSLTGQANLVARIAFPREILPLASVAASVIDLGIALLCLAGLMGFYRVAPTWNALYAIPILAVEVLLAAGVTLILSLVNVWYRDITQAAGLLLQLWMFLTPVLYPAGAIPAKYRALGSLNPMTGIIEGFRSAVIKGRPPEAGPLVLSLGIGLVVFLAGYAAFKLFEPRLADVI